ncbi:MAG: hypothetical protein LBK62_00460 [Treponema sp.]|nr:hypothetical protein [Treponema sp.]
MSGPAGREGSGAPPPYALLTSSFTTYAPSSLAGPVDRQGRPSGTTALDHTK